MAETMPIKCARCDVLLEARADKVLVCPHCGEQDTFENVMVDIGDYITREMAFRRSGENMEQPQTTRFKVDLGSPDIS